MKKIVIEIDPDGTTKVDAQGFKGKSCSLATKELELALAGSGDAVDKRPKPDYYATTGNTNTQHN